MGGLTVKAESVVLLRTTVCTKSFVVEGWTAENVDKSLLKVTRVWGNAKNAF